MAIAVIAAGLVFLPSSAAAAVQPEISAPPDQLVGEADGYVDLPVTLSAPGTGQVTVAYQTPGTTAAGSNSCGDYVNASGTLTFAPGETTKTVRVEICDDTFKEGLESFSLSLSSPTNATISRAAAKVSIVDNDNVNATPRLFARDATVDEKAGVALVPVLLGGTGGEGSASKVTVNYQTLDGTALAGSDYTATAGTLTFAPGQTVQTVAVPITDDALAEPNEVLSLKLGGAVNATLGDNIGTIAIGPNDATAVAQPKISAPADQLVGEADGYVDLPVTLSAPGTGQVTVAYQTPGTTAAGSNSCGDYVNASGTLTFAPGETTKTVRVEICDDTFKEGLESFSLSLSSPTNATISRAAAKVSIVDNDNVNATPRLFARDATVDEKAGVALVPVLLGGTGGEGSASKVTVNYQTLDGTALAGSDYTATAGTLTFAPGQTVQTVAVPITDDALAEPNEVLSLKLGGAVNATLGDNIGTIAIGPNDATAVAQPKISAPADQLVGEADGYVDLPVTLSAPGTGQVTVAYQTPGTTAAGSNSCGDYVNASGTLTFAPGETTKTVRVEICDDTFKEGLESFSLSLSSPTNATISRAAAKVSIVDNDNVNATPRLFARDATVDEKAGVALVPVLLGGTGGEGSASKVTVNYQTLDGTALAGSDYTATAGTLTFAPGQTVQTVAVPITDDALAEPNEVLSLKLGGAVNATLGDNIGTIAIGPNDATAVAQPKISAPADQLVGEADGYVDLPVTLSAPGTGQVTVAYQTPGTTAAGSNSCGDYVNASGTLTFAPGETTKTVRVEICDDTFKEGLESFSLSLSSPTNATISRAAAKVSIVDNDNVNATPRLFARDATVDEKAGVALVPVLLGGTGGEGSASKVTVNYQTLDGTALAGSDYTATAGTLTFAPGQTVQTVAVPITDDALAEPNEVLSLKLGGAVNATLGDNIGTIAIGPNDATAVAQPKISAPADQLVGEADGYVDLPVTLSAPGTGQVTVAYQTPGTTAAGSNSCGDYVNASGTLTFAPGETTKTVRVEICDDTFKEGLESFSLSLSSPTNATISRAASEVTIKDNDT